MNRDDYVTLSFICTKKEADIIRKAAKEKGITLSKFIRINILKSINEVKSRKPPFLEKLLE